MSRKSDLRLAGLLGERIGTRRLALGLSQREVAARVPLGRANYARLEAGRHLPMLPTLVAVARALELDLAELLVRLGAADAEPSAPALGLDERTAKGMGHG